MSIVKLSAWAKLNGYTYKGAYNRFLRGDLPEAFHNETGRLMVDISKSSAQPKQEKTVIYARVSSHTQKDQLNAQCERLTLYCMANGWKIDRIVKEIASGLNDNRPKLSSILNDDSITRIVVERKDRLTRFGFNYIEQLSDKTIEIANPATEEKDDLMQDLIAVITSMVARYYGQRKSKRITDKIILNLNEEKE